MLSRLFGQSRQDERAFRIYNALVEQARQPGFYRDCAVPDTVDGRFELIALHVFLVLHHLKQQEGAGPDLGQAVFDLFVQDMDASLREMGAGDLGVGKRVRTMIRGLFGRISVYEAALSAPTGELEAALARNLYGTVSPVPEAVLDSMAGYLRREAEALAASASSEISAGRLEFGPPPGPSAAPGAP